MRDKSNRVRTIPYGSTEVHCTDCDKWKNILEFYTNRRGYPLSYCKDCTAVRNRNRRKKVRLDPLRSVENRIKTAENQVTGTQNVLDDLLNYAWEHEDVDASAAVYRLVNELGAYLESVHQLIDNEPDYIPREPRRMDEGT